MSERWAREFWLVWCPDGTHPPRVEHRSEESAALEARRLASQYPGSVFHVLRAVGAACVPDAFQRVEVEVPF